MDRLKSCVNCGEPFGFDPGGMVLHEVEDESVLVVGIPHFYCDSCGCIAYPGDIPIKRALEHAYRENYNVIIW